MQGKYLPVMAAVRLREKPLRISYKTIKGRTSRAEMIVGDPQDNEYEKSAPILKVSRSYTVKNPAKENIQGVVLRTLLDK